jgi:hypothetical protein
MKTAIEELRSSFYSYANCTGLGDEYWIINESDFEFIINHIMKTKEKEQIVNAYFGGYLNGENKTRIQSEQYYKVTFEK